MSTRFAPQLNLPLGAFTAPDSTHEGITEPGAYKGLYAFHKYWGKKPHEVLGFVIDHLTEPHDIVLDPFMGSGTAGREALLRGRSFIGCDINPCSLRLANLMLSPPDVEPVMAAFDRVRITCQNQIYDTYQSSGATVPTHFLWQGHSLKEVWTTRKGNTEAKRAPHADDMALIQKFEEYQTGRFRPLRFFTNARINAFPNLGWRDIFTGRALHNIDLLHTAIMEQPDPARGALLLALTASCGQMSKMVFAITGRGKTQGKSTGRVEVGSWVIGFWRPELHFEINVWECFERRATKLLKALTTIDPLRDFEISPLPDDVVSGPSRAAIVRADCRKLVASLPSESVSLIVTDPPHSDRIPYLELSELWNAILDEEPTFGDELVVSNAKERKKSKKIYATELAISLREMARIMRPDGFLVLLFNARSAADWEGLTEHMKEGDGSTPLKYLGRFPVYYSAGSVVQDNRDGGLKHDFAMVFTKASSDEGNLSSQFRKLRQIPDWEAARAVHPDA
jgi:DNA methylase